MRAASLFLLAISAFGYEDYCPWFPMARLYEVKPRLLATMDGPGARSTFQIRRGQVSITRQDDDSSTIELRGKDDSGKPWQVVLDEIPAFRNLYVQDVDNNGREDFLVHSYTGAAGERPGVDLVTVLIDNTGKPRLWHIYLFSGVKLYDFDRNGHLEIVSTNYGLSNRDLHHYWTSTLYEARDANWHQVEGPHGPIQPPQFTAFTYRANRLPVHFGPGHAPFVPDGGSAPSFSGVLINRVAAAQPKPAANSQPQRREIYEWAKKVRLSNGKVCAISDYTPVVVEWQGQYRLRHGEEDLQRGPADLTVDEHLGLCFVNHVVIHATKAAPAAAPKAAFPAAPDGVVANPKP